MRSRGGRWSARSNSRSSDPRGRSSEASPTPSKRQASRRSDRRDACRFEGVGDASLETNKEFTRDLMRDHGIPGAPRSWAFDDREAFSDFVKASDFEFVIKPLGLTDR